MSRNFLDSRKSPPEKSNFAQTCNLLSQYLKEKGSLRDLNLGINGKLEASGRPETSTGTTLPLTDTDKSGQISAQHVNLVPKSARMGSYTSSIQEDGINDTTTSSEAAAVEPKTALMTIFYAGQVLVFDVFSADKAKEVMLLASKGSTGFVGTSSSLDKMDVESSSMPSASNIPSSLLDETWQKETQPIGSDLPIARRASLHRFLEKRKDRASARAPYQLHNPSAASTKEQFDLNS